MVCEQPRITELHRVKGGHAFVIHSEEKSYDLVLSPRLTDPGVPVVVEVTRLAGTRPRFGVSVAEGQVASCHEVPLPHPLFDPGE